MVAQGIAASADGAVMDTLKPDPGADPTILLKKIECEPGRAGSILSNSDMQR